MILLEKKKEMERKFTKYEIARILGARALQVSMNAPILIKLSEEELESMNYDPLSIAEHEFYDGVLPITVKRPFPQKLPEKVFRSEKKPEKKVEPAQKKESKSGEKKDDKAVHKKEPVSALDVGTEQKIIKETEDTEIMEMAQPEDEVEPAEDSPAED